MTRPILLDIIREESMKPKQAVKENVGDTLRAITRSPLFQTWKYPKRQIMLYRFQTIALIVSLTMQQQVSVL